MYYVPWSKFLPRMLCSSHNLTQHPALPLLPSASTTGFSVTCSKSCHSLILLLLFSHLGCLQLPWNLSPWKLSIRKGWHQVAQAWRWESVLLCPSTPSPHDAPHAPPSLPLLWNTDFHFGVHACWVYYRFLHAFWPLPLLQQGRLKGAVFWPFLICAPKWQHSWALALASFLGHVSRRQRYWHLGLTSSLLGGGGWPVHYRKYSRIPGLCPPDASSSPSRQPLPEETSLRPSNISPYIQFPIGHLSGVSPACQS